MNVLFLTLNVFTDIEMHNIYSDLMKVFIEHGHRPYIVTPREKKSGEKTELIDYADYSILKIQTGNTSHVSLIEKGISTVTIGLLYYHGVKKHLGSVKFDLILYSTPPITLATPVVRLKKLFTCRTYLMLKDIFPQNAVDLHMFSEKSLIYRYFRNLEKKLYAISDRIGCMSPANVRYLLQHNAEVDKQSVEICANSIIPKPLESREGYKRALREKYAIPYDATVFLYGGNLGRPQSIPFLIACLKRLAEDHQVFTIICGFGNDFGLLKKFVDEERPANVRLFKELPNDEYQVLAKGCDVGLIMLDYRFTIPNFPSRVLTYMENSMPVLVCSDTATDMGKIAEENGFGVACSSDRIESYCQAVKQFKKRDLMRMGKRARAYLEKAYLSEYAYRAIMGNR